MKQLLISLLLIVPLTLGAKTKDDSKYLAGAVPEENGQIVFKKSFRVPGKSQQEIHDVLANWAGQLVEESIPAPGNYARIMEDSQDSIVARVCEWMVFKKKKMYLDRTRFRYQLTARLDGDHVTLSAITLYYYYGEDMEGSKGQLIKAEEWISDKEAMNKAQTKLYPKSDKFRRRTVDRMEALFDSAMDAIEKQGQEDVQTEKPTRKGIVEE